jgi:salicylate hydroxylase
MKIVIVGAGIGGLSASLALARNGHCVTVYESAPQLAEVGAGVQMSPNAVKLFFEWGVGPDLLEKAALPQSLYIHNWKDGRILGETKITPDFEKRYGAPYIVVHRAEMHEILHRHAVRAGVTVHVASKVIKYDFEQGVITLEDGQTVQADLIVAVDGASGTPKARSEEFLT